MSLDTQTYELVPVEQLTEHPDNPRRGDVEAIQRSIRANGWHGALVAQRSTGYVLAGNHRLKAARGLGYESVPVLWLDVDDRTAARVLVADNRASDLSTFDHDALMAVLDAADESDLAGMLFSADDLADLVANPVGSRTAPPGEGGVDMEEGEAAEGEPDGLALPLVDVTYGDPSHTVTPGDHWLVGRHHLHAVDPYRGWVQFVDDLEPGMLLLPYPEPYITLSTRAQETSMVLVQPRPFLAGHLLDKHAARFGEDDLELVGR